MHLAFVAPPFAGHLFPLLDLATQLEHRLPAEIVCYSTPEASHAAKMCGVAFHPLLVGSSHHVVEIANPQHRVGSNPVRLWRQLRMNLALMDQLQQELRSQWSARRPALVVADFTVPVAGLTARSMGIPWWTSMPTPCALETSRGVPSYLGGWKPWNSPLGRFRDGIGRAMIRGFKRSVHALLRQPLRRCGIERVYRADGSELIYSDERILGLGAKHFELERNWPSQLEFIGPLTGCPPFEHESPQYAPSRPHVLITLGTHLKWAKHDARELFKDVARQMPDISFHFTQGVASKSNEPESIPANTDETDPLGNFRTYRFIAYDQYLSHYAAVVHHGGTGILYACLKQARPALVWPQDYDQFDHAARLEYHGLARRLCPRPNWIVTALRQLLQDQPLRQQLEVFQRHLSHLNPAEKFAERLAELIAQ